MTDQQLYSTPDGSVWWIYPARQDGEIVGDRINSPDGSHDNDFRAQQLSEIVKYWGSLSLYDPLKEQVEVLTKALDSEEVHWWGARHLIEAAGVEKLSRAIDALGYEIRKKED